VDRPRTCLDPRDGLARIGHPHRTRAVLREVLHERRLWKAQLEPVRTAGEDPLRRADPQAPATIFVDAVDGCIFQLGGARDSFPFVTAEGGEAAATRRPHDPVAVLCERSDRAGKQPRVGREACDDIPLEPLDAAGAAMSNPERSVARPEHGRDRAICNRRRFIVEWAFHKRRAIEADEAAIGPEPEITVAILGDRKDVAEQHVVLRSPGGESVAGRVRRLVARLGNERRRTQQHDQHRRHEAGGSEGRGCSHAWGRNSNAG
jgi:hypothetical protein